VELGALGGPGIHHRLTGVVGGVERASEDGCENCDSGPCRRMMCMVCWPLDRHRQGSELWGEGESRWSDGNKHSSGLGEEWGQEGPRRERRHGVE
jgi:hypothetical protein